MAAFPLEKVLILAATPQNSLHNNCSILQGLCKEKQAAIYDFFVKPLVNLSGKEDNYNVQLFSDLRRIV